MTAVLQVPSFCVTVLASWFVLGLTVSLWDWRCSVTEKAQGQGRRNQCLLQWLIGQVLGIFFLIMLHAELRRVLRRQAGTAKGRDKLRRQRHQDFHPILANSQVEWSISKFGKQGLQISAKVKHGNHYVKEAIFSKLLGDSLCISHLCDL